MSFRRRRRRRRRPARIHRSDSSVPWLAIAAVGTTPPVHRRSQRRAWSLVPIVAMVAVGAWLLIVRSSGAHEHTASGIERAAAHGGAGHGGAGGEGASGTGQRTASDPFTPGLRAWLAHRGDVTAAVEDLHSGRTWVYRPGHPEHTASIVKVDILAALLHRDGGLAALSEEDRELATGMIESSDDDDATDLWDVVGGSGGVQAFDDAVGMRHTSVNIAWGLTTTTPQDQLRLLRTVLFKSPLLSAASQRYEYGLMRDIIPFDTWGVTAGPEGHAKVAFKNGWLPYDGSWQINSIGAVRGDGRHYLIAVMTVGSPSEGDGIDTVQRVSRAAWVHLDVARRRS